MNGRIFAWVGVAILGKGIVAALPDEVIRSVFCVLPAQMSAWYYGVALEPEKLVFRVGEIALAVTTACAGADFFVLAASLLGVIFWIRKRKLVIAAPLIAWGLTIALNTCRLIALVPVERIWPREEVPIVHLGVGVVFFLPVLCFIWYNFLGKENVNGRTK